MPFTEERVNEKDGGNRAWPFRTIRLFETADHKCPFFWNIKLCEFSPHPEKISSQYIPSKQGFWQVSKLPAESCPWFSLGVRIEVWGALTMLQRNSWVTGLLCKCDRRGSAVLLCSQHCTFTDLRHPLSHLLFFVVEIFKRQCSSTKLESLCLGRWSCSRRKAESNCFLTF